MDLKLAPPARPRLAYGFWRYRETDLGAARAMLERARAAGIDHLDTADCYGGEFGGAERLLGALRKDAPSLFDGAVLASKVGVEFGTPYNSAPDYIARACDASLARLGVARIDLLYIHRHDLVTHPADLAGALDALIAAGKVASVGVSNFTAAQIDALTRHLKAPLAAHQVEFSPWCVDAIFDGTADQAMGRGFSLAAWSPLAGGKLGQASAGEDAGLTRVRARLAELAQEKDAPLAAIALAFIMRHASTATPIIGTTTPARFDDCLRARDVELTRREWYSILEARRGAKMP